MSDDNQIPEPVERSRGFNEVNMNTLIQQTHEFLFERRKTLLDENPEGQKIKMSSLPGGQASLKQAFDYGDRNSRYGKDSTKTSRVLLENQDLLEFIQQAHLKQTPESTKWGQVLGRLAEYIAERREKNKIHFIRVSEYKPQHTAQNSIKRAIDEVLLGPLRPQRTDNGSVWMYRAKPRSLPVEENSEVTTYGAPRHCEAVKFLANWEIQSQVAQPRHDGLTPNWGVSSAFRTLDQQKALRAKAASRSPTFFFHERHTTRPSDSPLNSVENPPTCYTPDPNTP